MWLRQLKVLDQSRNAFRITPPILMKYKATPQELNLQGALVKRAMPLSNNEDMLSTDENAGSNSGADACSSSDEDAPSTESDEERAGSLAQPVITVSAANIEDFLYLFDNVGDEIDAANREDKAFSAAACRLVYQQLLDAGIDVQIDEAAWSDNFTRR